MQPEIYFAMLMATMYGFWALSIGGVYWLHIWLCETF